MGMVPAGPRAAWAGRPAPTHWSSMPPVPKVALARPARVQPWPMSEACWSPAIPAIGGAPSRIVGRADGTRRVDDGRAGRPRGCAAASRSSALHPDPSPSSRPVTPALEASVTWSRPPDSVQATQVSTVPKASSPRSDRARSGSARSSNGGQLGGRCVGGHPDALGLELEAGADGAQVLPAEARPDRHAGGPVPHDGRRPLVGDADGVDRAAFGQAAAGHLDHGVGHGRGVELDQAGERGVGQDRHVVDVLDGAVGADHRTPHPRGADVDDQDAHGQGTSPKGLARPSLPGLRMPWGSRACLSEVSTSKPRPGRRAGTGPG